MLRLDGKLQFRLAKLGGEVVTPEALPPDLLFGPSRRPPSERVSSVFDSACISATSYEKLREDKWAERSQDSLRNPTKAMLDIMKKMKAEKNQDTVKTPKGRKRTKSFSDVDNTNSTPAMMEVMRLKKLKSMDDANEELLNCDTPVALLKLPFKLSPVTITKEILEEPAINISSALLNSLATKLSVSPKVFKVNEFTVDSTTSTISANLSVRWRGLAPSTHSRLSSLQLTSPTFPLPNRPYTLALLLHAKKQHLYLPSPPLTFLLHLPLCRLPPLLQHLQADVWRQLQGSLVCNGLLGVEGEQLEAGLH